jgi:arabinofuranosyltransferase
LGFSIIGRFHFDLPNIFFYQGRLSIFDDAFITFRYSKNLAQGLGPVFNPGQPVEGYTNFLWMLLLAIGKWLGFDILSLSQVLGVISCLLVLLLTYQLGMASGLSKGLSIFPVLLLSINPGFVRYSVSGMETLFFTTWLIAAYIVLLSNPSSKSKTMLSSLLLVLATLTRPEGLVFLVILSSFHVFILYQNLKPERSERVIKSITSYLFLWFIPWLLIFFPYLAWKLWFYGDLLPNTFYVKVDASNLDIIVRGLVYIGLMFIVVNMYIFILTLLLPFLHWTNQWRLLAVSVILKFCYIVYIGGDEYTVFGPRFILPVLPFLVVLGIAALKDTCDRLSIDWGRIAYLVSLLLVIFIAIVGNHPERTAYINVMNILARGWINTGEWLAERASSDEVIAVDAAGIIPYITGLQTIDMYGLNDPFIAKLPPHETEERIPGHEKYAPQYVLDHEPDYVLSWMNNKGQPTTAGLPTIMERFEKEYELYAIVLMREPRGDEPAIIETRQLDPHLHDQDYTYAIFIRRSGIQ